MGQLIVPRPTTSALAGWMERITDALHAHGEVGLVTATVLSTKEKSNDRWADYEAMVHEAAAFVQHFVSKRLRQSDLLLEPILSGNTHVLVISPPRDGRALTQDDVDRVAKRLQDEIRVHLDVQLRPETLDRYGLFVGQSILTDRPDADAEALIYHGIEEAQARAGTRRRAAHRENAAALHELLDQQDVSVVYQPLIDTIDKRVLGYEALTRTSHERFQSPETLFRTAADEGSLWALERICRNCALQNLPALESDQKLFLNVEPETFHDPELQSESFLEAIQQAGLQPSRVVFELTERAAVRDFVAMRRILARLRGLGFPLALDDVGSGYAGLQTIAEIQPDYLKIDMAIVRNLHRHAVRRELIRAICDFSQRTSTTLIAEGVETLDELETLVANGVRCVQGFLVARPSSSPDTPDWDRF